MYLLKYQDLIKKLIKKIISEMSVFICTSCCSLPLRQYDCLVQLLAVGFLKSVVPMKDL